MAEGLRKTLSHAGIYGTGTMLQNIVSFIMLPIYTRYLTPEDYGILNLLEVVVSMIGVFVGSQLAVGIFRYYFAARDKDDANSVVSTAMILVLAGKAAGVLVLLGLADTLAPLVFGEVGYAEYVRLFAFVLLTDALFQIPFMYLRALERPVSFVSLSIVKLLLQLSLNVYFVVHLELGVLGVIYASVLAGASLGGAMALWALRHTGGRFRPFYAKKLFTYSWPIIIAGFIGVYNSQGQRYFLNLYWNLAEVGLYGLAWRIAGVLNVMIWQPLNQVWGVQRFKVYDEPDGVETFQRMFTFIVVLFTAVGAGIAIVAEEVLQVMSAEPFWGAAKIVPYLVLAAMLNPLEIFCRMGIIASEKTHEILRGRILSGIVVTIGFILLIPPLAGIGAAIAVIGARAAMLWWIHRQARKVYDMALPWWKFFLAVGLAVAAYLASLAAPAAIIPALGFKLALWVALCLAMFYSPILGRRERRAFFRLSRDAFGWLSERVGL